MSGGALTHAERRLVAGVVLIVGAYTMVAASYNYILQPMLDGFGASESRAALVRQLPSIATLLVVFLSAVLGDRIGDRRTLVYSAWLFVAGSLAVAMAPGFALVVAGLVVQGVAVSGGSVLAVGLLSSKIHGGPGRASAFAAFAIVAPLVNMALPLAAGLLVDRSSWRWVAVLWALGGLVAVWACRRLLPADGRLHGTGEFITPLLAGLVLVGVVQTIDAAKDHGLTSTETLARLAVTALSGAILWIVFRRSSSPSLSLAPLRKANTVVLLAVVLLFRIVSFYFYATMTLLLVFGLSTFQTALAMVPVQLGAVLGSVITRKVLQRRGVEFTGVVQLIVLAVAVLPIWAIAADSPLWVPIATFALFAAAYTGAGIPIMNAVMNAASPGQDGSASAYRTASAQVGAAVGVVFTTAIVMSATTVSVTDQVEAQQLASSDPRQIVESLLDGSTQENAASEYAVPVGNVITIDDDLANGLVQGLHFVALAGSAVSLLCAGMFAYAVRRRTPSAGQVAEPA